MKNKKLLAMTAMVITASVLMSACSFGGNDKKEDTPAVAVTPTAEPTATPAPTIEPTHRMYRAQLIHPQISQSRSTFRMPHGPIRQTRQIW